MSLERIEFEKQYRDLLPQLTPVERAMFEHALGVSRNGKSPPVTLPESLAEREQLWLRVKEKLVSQSMTRRRGYGNG